MELFSWENHWFLRSIFQPAMFDYRRGSCFLGKKYARKNLERICNIDMNWSSYKEWCSYWRQKHRWFFIMWICLFTLNAHPIDFVWMISMISHRLSELMLSRHVGPGATQQNIEDMRTWLQIGYSLFVSKWAKVYRCFSSSKKLKWPLFRCFFGCCHFQTFCFKRWDLRIVWRSRPPFDASPVAVANRDLPANLGWAVSVVHAGYHTRLKGQAFLLRIQE